MVRMHVSAKPHWGSETKGKSPPTLGARHCAYGEKREGEGANAGASRLLPHFLLCNCASICTAQGPWGLPTGVQGAYKLCDLGQVTSALCPSASASVKWADGKKKQSTVGFSGLTRAKCVRTALGSC